MRKGHLIPNVNVIYTDTNSNTYTYISNVNSDINNTTNTAADTKLLSLFCTKTENDEVVLFVDRIDADPNVNTNTNTDTNTNNETNANNANAYTNNKTISKSQFTPFSDNLQLTNNDIRNINQSSSLLLLPSNDPNDYNNHSNRHNDKTFGKPNSFTNTNTSSSSFTQNVTEPLQYIHENNDNNHDNHDEKRRKLDENIKYSNNDKENRTLGTW